MRSVVVVLDNIRSLYNVGSFFRTADGAGVTKIICCGITGTPTNPRLGKVALGAEKIVPWSQSSTTEQAITELKIEGYQIVGVERADDSVAFNDAKYTDNVAVIFGSETDGLNQAVLQLCDFVVSLPMRGQKESLNVSVAGGVMLYYLLTS